MNLKEKVRRIQEVFCEKKEKASDLEVIVAQMKELPYGQLKRMLTDEVLIVLEKYGCGEGFA